MYMDTMFAKHKSLQGNTCVQVYCCGFDWVWAFPMKKKLEAHLTLDLLHQRHGVPATLIPDNALELVSGEF
jgi:hypothetical protein